MALLGLYGMFASGKTFMLENRRDEIADNLSLDFGLVIAHADIAKIVGLSKNRDVWESSYEKRAKWKGSKNEKIDQLMFMVEDKSTVWILESARYFGGFQDDLLAKVKECKGGLAFVVPYVEPDTGLQFLKERAERVGKGFREDYWGDIRRLEYECKARYLNPINRYYIPAGIPCWPVEIDYERKNWDYALTLIKDIVCWNGSDWYGKTYIQAESGSSKRGQREREDNHSASADIPIKRQPLTHRH